MGSVRLPLAGQDQRGAAAGLGVERGAFLRGGIRRVPRKMESSRRLLLRVLRWLNQVSDVIINMKRV